MSKVFKKVGKVFKSVASAVTKKVKQVVKSKAFKVLAGAALIYFGGAGLMAMSSGGTFASGVSAAWSGATSAVTSLASGNFAQAGSALKAGFTGTAATSAATGAATSGEILASLGGNTGVSSAAAGSTAGGVAGAADITAALGASAPAAVPAATTAAAPAGLFGLGEMGTAALISSGVQMAGSTIAGAGQDKAEKEARERMTYAGVNGKGVGTGLDTDGLFNPVSMNSIAPSTAQWTPNNMDDIVRMYSAKKV